MNRLESILHYIKNKKKQYANAKEIGEAFNISRSVASRYLNELVKDNKMVKIHGKPVIYEVITENSQQYGEQHISGMGSSLEPILKEGMAAFLYPSKPLPILLTGETGTGKTYLAEKLASFVKGEVSELNSYPFVTLNCADYAQNTELLVGQIFGIKKGAFTGADQDTKGLVEQADGGILFLDEIHRLPPSGQEMLFYLLDKGIYHRLGEATHERKASIALIGATTENPEKTLLATLVRRFSIKLTIPPLRHRTIEEHKNLIYHFLREEQEKMNAKLRIDDSSLDILLNSEYPGNIGQLQNVIQIACARAYFDFLNSNHKEVIIRTEDLSDDKNESRSLLQKSTGAIEDKQTSTLEEETADSCTVPNIYKQLDNVKKETNSSEKRKSIIFNYIEEITNKYSKVALSETGWQNMMDDDLLQVINGLKRNIISFEVPINQNQLFVIGLHIQNYRNHLTNQQNNSTMPVLIHPNVAYRQAAQQFANYVEQEINLSLPIEEVELIAHFLTPESSDEQQINLEHSITVLLITHGKSTATSMAEVSNFLLGNDVIKSIDMPLYASVDDTYKRVKQQILQSTNPKGVLLLVDIGSLITMGDTLQHELDIPINTLSSVNLPMVLEAGRKSLMEEKSLSEVSKEAQKGMLTFVENKENKTAFKKNRLIVTVCFTGEGAAQMLESWVEDQLSPFDQDVLIRSVRVEPTNKDVTVLKELKQYYNIILIIGTVPVSIGGIPFIPAWELLQPDGVSRMQKLLEISRQNISLPEPESDITNEEIYPLITEGLGEITTNVNPKKIAQILQLHMDHISSYYNWDTNRELGMWMHLGSLIDRLTKAVLDNKEVQFLASIPVNSNTIPSSEEVSMWQPLISDIETTFLVTFAEEIKLEIIKLSR